MTIPHHILLIEANEVDAMLIKAEVHNILLKKLGRRCFGTCYSILHREEEDRGSTQKAQKRFQTVFEKAPFGIALINLRTGKYYDELLGINPSDIIHLDDLSSYKNDIKRIVSQQLYDSKIVTRILRSDMSVIWIEMSIVLFETVGDLEVCYLCMIEDITERKRLIENLRHLTTHLQDVREEERTRIGRKIHDVLGGTLTVLKMDLDWLSKNKCGTHA